MTPVHAPEHLAAAAGFFDAACNGRRAWATRDVLAPTMMAAVNKEATDLDIFEILIIAIL